MVSSRKWLAPTLVLLVILGVLLVERDAVSLQLPPQTNIDGIPFFMVNINPTSTPPLVNINPPGRPPRVEIDQMPAVEVQQRGCDDGGRFETGLGGTIEGPIVLTYLSVEEDTAASLTTREETVGLGTRLGDESRLSTTIYLGPDQELNFSTVVLYSGCRPS